MIIFGFHPVREALRLGPGRVARILVSERRTGARRREIEALCAAAGVPCEAVPEARLSTLAPGVHNGFLAEVRGAPRPSGAGDLDLLVLVEDVQDPRNLGALLRVCEGAGVGRVVIRDRGTAPLSPAVVKTSAGAAEWLAIERVANTAAALKRLKQEGFWTYGADVAGRSVWEVDLTGRVVLCFGGEEKGLRPLTRQLCDALLALPMQGRVESLNLATAAAAILYEALRQRTLGSQPFRGHH